MLHRGMLVVALVAVAACDDSTQSVPSLTAPPALTATGVRAYVVQEPGGTPERTMLTIHVDARDVAVASYQGQLQFDAGTMEIIDAASPMDGTRLVNATSAGPGLVKFAGFSAEAFTQTAAAHIAVRLVRPIEEAHLVATLDVVGEVTGSAIARDRVMQQRGIFSRAATTK